MPHLSDSERAQQKKIYIPHPWNCCDNPKAIHPDRTYFSLFRSLSLSLSVCHGRAFRAQLFVDVFLASLSSSRKRTRTQQIASIMQMCVLGTAAAAAAVERVAAVRLCVATAASHTHTRAHMYDAQCRQASTLGGLAALAALCVLAPFCGALSPRRAKRRRNCA